MQKIKSFERNHNCLKAGLYLQEKRKNILIFDLRFAEPNTKVIPISAIHTIEHLFAYWFKNTNFGDSVISFNAGACQTMFYLEISDDVRINLKANILKCIDWCLEQTSIIGASAQECGNYKSHDLGTAKIWLKKYKQILEE